jgi:hypothetical protein
MMTRSAGLKTDGKRNSMKDLLFLSFSDLLNF